MSSLWDFIQSPFKNLKDYLSSMNIHVPHVATNEEIASITNTNLFRKMSEDELAKLIYSIHIKKYRAGDLILKEGDVGNELFIILEGSARVFIMDEAGNKTQLKVLLSGHYFGEQAISKEKNRTRNASIEAITDISLIKIPGKHIYDFLLKDASLSSLIEERKMNQSVNIISHVSIFQHEIESLLSKFSNTQVIEFRNKECIFQSGDKADHVYIVIQGKVKLFIPQKNNDSFSELILNKGHLFGELGVMNDMPRSGTAIADGHLRLLAIDGDEFKRDAAILNNFKIKLSNLQKMYALPLRGAVEQYTRVEPNSATSIINIYKLENNRVVHSSNVLDTDEFSMGATDHAKSTYFRYDNGDNHVEIFVHDHRLIGIKANGSYDGLPELCYILLDNVKIEEKDLELFKAAGKLKLI